MTAQCALCHEPATAICPQCRETACTRHVCTLDSPWHMTYQIRVRVNGTGEEYAVSRFGHDRMGQPTRTPIQFCHLWQASDYLRQYARGINDRQFIVERI